MRMRLTPRFGLIVLSAAATTAFVFWLGQDIVERRQEARVPYFQVVTLTEETTDPAEWAKNFPRQYDGYRRTVDTERTRHGGSEAFQKLDEDPRWRTLFAGYAFGVDYREERGHAFMLQDQDETERTKRFPQPGACLHCHSSVIPAYVAAGKAAGAATREDQVRKGFELLCAETWREARPKVQHPVSCIDCHEPSAAALRVTRPAFFDGIRALAASDEPVPHLPSIERWRAGDRKTPYDPNALASRQEMRTFVCAQCHVEYRFAGKGKLLEYPWARGLAAEKIEAFYDAAAHTDWTHEKSGAPLLKAQHPEFETWSKGVHARSGVSCADCHMPYRREGAMKVTEHHIRSPLLSVTRSCQTCHRFPEGEILARANAIQDRTKAMLSRAEDAVLALVAGIERAQGDTAPARALHRQAQWRLDFVAAENSMGFHAPHETARLLLEAVDLARQGEVLTTRLERRP